jgi:UDP-N-acetylmuramoyl-tripeptide--D-alanyl-D-alanine ligase
MQKQRIMEGAKAKMKTVHPIVIGVTGSYGKTSTKEFLKTILSQRYNVLATPKNVNVDIGIASVVLNELNEKHDVFIVEMGAYRRGEIASSCDIVHPIIGVITTIKEQHLALFGSREAIKHAKAELYQSLPPSGLAVVNRDNPQCIEVANLTDAKKKFFSTQDVAHVYASDIHVEPNELMFTLHCGSEKSSVRTALHGQQVVPSILAAVVVADHLGMSLKEIIAGIEKLEPLEGSMHLRSGKNHALIIDDHYNSNPDGFLAAINYLSIFQERRKIIITPGMMELGSESDMHHRTVGARAGEVADLLFITKDDFAKPLWDAAKSGGLQEERIIIEDRPGKLIERLSECITPNDVVLIEGRIYKNVYNALLKP